MATSITLVPVTDKNREEICQLSVREDQIDFVWDNRRTLDALDEWRSEETVTVPLGIYWHLTPVGFAMYTVVLTKHSCFIDRVMVDSRFQGQGIGKQATLQMLRSANEQFGATIFTIGVDTDNDVAKHVYASAGFRFKEFIPNDPAAEFWELSYPAEAAL